MNTKIIKSIADAVLYEGYMLYPYRPSAVKNRQRWNFGVVCPKPYSESQKGTDSWFTQTQCLIRGNEATALNVHVRFLQAVARHSGPVAESNRERMDDLEPSIGGDSQPSWQETMERDVILPPVRLSDLIDKPVRQIFTFPNAPESMQVEDAPARPIVLAVHADEALVGCIEVSAEECASGDCKVTVLVSNLSALVPPQTLVREAALLKSLLSTHTILSATNGEFVSLMDPPAESRKAAAECRNIGTWPVLVGDENARDAMLSAPIILYDYPQIAPESAGDLFDGTEIDEILALRILTLSDDEKREVRESDDRARAILDRTEALPAEHFLKLHGVLHGMKPANHASDDLGGEGEK